MGGFEGKQVVVTGAGSGIGRAMAHVFGELGAELVLADIDEQRVGQVRAELESGGRSVVSYRVDVADQQGMEAFARAVEDERGAPDVLINNAGVALGGELVDTPLESFRRLMEVNFWGAVHGVHAFVPAMLARGSGHIVNIVSVNGLAPIPFNGPYNASKFALMGYTESLRMELADRGIGVLAVCPGLIRTAIARDRQGDFDSPRAARTTRKFERAMAEHGADPFDLARLIPPAIARNQAVLKAPFDALLLSWIHGLFPGFYERLCGRVLKGEKLPYRWFPRFGQRRG